MKFLSPATGLANEENRGMVVAGMTAGHIGIEAFDLVGEAEFLKEIQRAIDRRRFGGAFAVQLAQKVVGLCRSLSVEQELQHFPPDRRQALALFLGNRLGHSEKVRGVLRATGRVDVMGVGHAANVGRVGREVKR